MAKKTFILICLASLILFLPSFFNFFSHDDFFNLEIARVNSFGDILNFFNIFHAPAGFGFYRPLSTQSYFAIDYLFSLNPLVIHLISFLFFIVNNYLIFLLIKKLFAKEKMALMGTFLYAVSAIHFGHLYYPSAFQELLLGTFTFLGMNSFADYLDSNKLKKLILAFLCLIFGLFSKETAVIIPILYGILMIFKDKRNFFVFIPMILIVLVYFYLHSIYGFAQGDSYIWNFSPRVLNTLAWYLLWSLNLPEMLVDYIGPGLHISSNLMRFYRLDILPIIATFVVMLSTITVVLLRSLKEKDIFRIFLFSAAIFLVGVLPVAFLPLHKFSYELTIPLLGVVIFLAYLLERANKSLIIIFLGMFLLLSVLTNILTFRVSWITQGGVAAMRVFAFINSNISKNSNYRYVMFVDTPDDRDLPWSPTDQIRIVLSGESSFDVFYRNRLTPIYGYNPRIDKSTTLKINSRSLLYNP